MILGDVISIPYALVSLFKKKKNGSNKAWAVLVTKGRELLKEKGF